MPHGPWQTVEMARYEAAAVGRRYASPDDEDARVMVDHAIAVAFTMLHASQRLDARSALLG